MYPRVTRHMIPAWSAGGNICAIILGSKTVVQTCILSAMKNFCANMLSGQQDFFQTFLVQSKTFVQSFQEVFCSNILAAKQDFCSNILDAKQDFDEPLWMKANTFV